MIKHRTKLLVIVTVFLGMAATLVPFVLRTTYAATPGYSGLNNHGYTALIGETASTLPMISHPEVSVPNPVTVVPKAGPAPVPAAGDSALLNDRQRFALGMIETANNDDEIGGAGEVSRYQIMPSVWKRYNGSRNYRNPAVSLAVARQHWSVLYATFIKQAHREPTDFDMYVLWNTRYGYYASRGFNPGRLHPVVRDRAERFTNLVERGES